MMEVFAGFLSHTDHQVGRLLDFLASEGKLDNTLIMVISDNGASAEGGPTGTTNEAQFFNNAPEPLEESLTADRRARRPQALQPLPVGLDVGREHAVPALEARDLPRRLDRPVHRLLAEGDQGAGARCAPQYAHIIDMVPTVLDLLGVSPPATIRGVTQSPMHGVSFAHTLDGCRGGDPSPHPVLRDARPPRHLPRRLAGGLPVARARRSPRPAKGFGEPISRADALRAGRRRAGSCTTSPRTSPRTTTSPPTTATG